MNIFVLLKQVPDTETKIRVTGDKNNIEKGDIKWIINPYDEFAIEEALKTKERLKEGTVTVVTVGPDRAVEALRTAVAMGADNAIHVKVADDSVDNYIAARALAEVLKKETRASFLPANRQSTTIRRRYSAMWLNFSACLRPPSSSRPRWPPTRRM